MASQGPLQGLLLGTNTARLANRPVKTAPDTLKLLPSLHPLPPAVYCSPHPYGCQATLPRTLLLAPASLPLPPEPGTAASSTLHPAMLASNQVQPGAPHGSSVASGPAAPLSPPTLTVLHAPLPLQLQVITGAAPSATSWLIAWNRPYTPPPPPPLLQAQNPPCSRQFPSSRRQDHSGTWGQGRGS